jgi:hypothetical protein
MVCVTATCSSWLRISRPSSSAPTTEPPSPSPPAPLERIQAAILYPTQSPAKAPAPLRSTDEYESISSPHNKGIIPPIVDPMRIPIQIDDRMGGLSICGRPIPGRLRCPTGGVFNMPRNLGGAFGTAMLATIVTKREQLHSSVIGSDVTLFRDSTSDRAHQLIHEPRRQRRAWARREAIVALANRHRVWISAIKSSLSNWSSQIRRQSS